jgi:uncharacterized protein
LHAQCDARNAIPDSPMTDHPRSSPPAAPGPLRRGPWLRLAAWLTVLAAIAAAVAHFIGTENAINNAHRAACNAGLWCKHVKDAAGLLPDEDRWRLDQYSRWVFRESDVDMRFVFVNGTGGKKIEQFAVDTVEALGIGGKTREERGVLFLYDLAGKKARIEVGYGLEGFFPDAFVSYLIHDHARELFASRDISLALRLLLRMLHTRIRQAVLGAQFDPGALEVARSARNLSGGAGATVATETGVAGGPRPGALPAELRRKFGPQPSPADAYSRYLQWLALGVFDPDLALFTGGTRSHLARLPMTTAYFDYILFQEHGRSHRIEVRGDLALLYFTSDPLVSPHFFVRGREGWQMDIASEVANIRNRVGGVYIWDYGGAPDNPYTRAFGDLLYNAYGYTRIRGGDNRALPIRGSQ